MATKRLSTGADMSKEAHSGALHAQQSPVDEGQIVTKYDNGTAPSVWTRMGVTPSSFKRRTLADQHNQLNQTMKSRHLNMIAIGGSIGAGLFVGSGGALRRGGPGALLLDFGIIGIVCRIALHKGVRLSAKPQ